MKFSCIAGAGLVAVLLLDAGMAAQSRDRLRIRIGTVAPRATAWEETLQFLRQEWQQILGPTLDMQILSDGVLGDETALVMKARTGQIEGIGASSVGLSRIDPGINCLQIPLMFDTWDEFDHVRDRVAPAIEARLEARGYKLLHWADGGWVYAFSVSPAPRPADLKRLRLFTSAGDSTTEALYVSLGFDVVVLPLTDVAIALQRRQLDVIPTVPLFALHQNLFRRLSYVTDLPWMPLTGATIVSRSFWERFPPDQRSALADAARRAGDRLRPIIREMDASSIKAMQQRGLTVVDVDEAVRAEWRREAEQAWQRMEGGYCSPDLFEMVRRARTEYRAKSRAREAGIAR